MSLLNMWSLYLRCNDIPSYDRFFSKRKNIWEGISPLNMWSLYSRSGDIPSYDRFFQGLKQPLGRGYLGNLMKFIFKEWWYPLSCQGFSLDKHTAGRFIYYVRGYSCSICEVYIWGAAISLPATGSFKGWNNHLGEDIPVQCIVVYILRVAISPLVTCFSRGWTHPARSFIHHVRGYCC